MRFHCGLSFSPKFSFKWLLLIGAGLVALFSNILIVSADVSSFTDAPTLYYYRPNSADPIFPNVLISSSDYYYYPNNNNGFNATQFTTYYNFPNYSICDSGTGSFKISVSLLDSQGMYINDGVNFTGVTNGSLTLSNLING